MNESESLIAEQLGRMASVLQQQRTGLAPKAATAVLCEDTIVVTLHGALAPAEKTLCCTSEGASQVQDFHRQLFSSSFESMHQEIKKITGREVREATVETNTKMGAVAHAFTIGTMVQVFLLSPKSAPSQVADRASIDRADDDGLHA